FASLFRSKAERPKAKPKSQASAPNRRGTAPEPNAKEPLSKKARKRMKAQQKQEPASKSSNSFQKKIPGDADAGQKAAPKRPNSVLGGAAQRLKGSRFRCLNESLYTMTGQEALKMFTNDPSLAEAYHEGFRAQASKWPRNPLDGVISWLRKEVPKEAVIGDFGCGDARLALELSKRKVHSFDLVKINERVTACNLAHVPLPDASLDVAVFCLALMGTDWIKFVEEAMQSRGSMSPPISCALPQP
ncbi:rrp8, partial [Symbiodinium sp. CCMP2456]